MLCVLWNAMPRTYALYALESILLKQRQQPLAGRSAKKTNTLGHQGSPYYACALEHLFACGRMFWNTACVAKTERGGCASLFTYNHNCDVNHRSITSAPACIQCDFDCIQLEEIHLC